MNISAHNLYSEMQQMARGAGNISGDLSIQPKETNASTTNFAGMLKDAIDNVNSIQKEAGAMRKAVEMGDKNVTLAQAMIAGQKSSVAFEATVQVRNKLMEAYKEVMNMPV